MCKTFYIFIHLYIFLIMIQKKKITQVKNM